MSDGGWHRLTRWGVPGLLTWLLRVVVWTWSVDVVGAQYVEAARRDHRVILAFWHGAMLPLVAGIPRLRRTTRLAMLRAELAQTRFVAAVVAPLGVEFTGAAHGTEALLKAARVIQKGASMAVALDGPAGPREHARSGASILSRMTGVPVIPVVVDVRRGTTLRTFWDEAIVPWPFARITIRFGAPIEAPKGRAEVRGHVHSLQQAMEQGACVLRPGA